MRISRYDLLAIVVLSTIWGCSGGGNEQPAPVQQRVALKTFDSCGALENYIEDVAVREMKLAVDSVYGGKVLFDRGGVAVPEAAMDAGASGENGASQQSEPSAHTTTNNQIAGVDEPDIVKNDGTRLFVLSGQNLYAAKTWPVADMALAGRLRIEGQPIQMALEPEKDRVVVYSSVYMEYDGAQTPRPGATEPDLRGACTPEYCGGYGAPATKITVVDVSDLARPTVEREILLPGSYVNARRIDSTVRLVLRDNVQPVADLQYAPDYSEDLYNDEERLKAARESLKIKNERLIREQTLEQWLPHGQVKGADGTTTDLGYACEQFYYSDAPVRLGLATVVTLNLDQPDTVNQASIVGEVGEIFASRSSLYLASPHWWWWLAVDQTDYTYLHKFDISDVGGAVYVASGAVEGHIVDQFAMDEHEGFLRVATTINSRVADPEQPWRQLTTNRVSVLAESKGALEVVGQTKDLAEGEQIYSARFIGDKGYVVTFRQVDPMFTIDLSQPTAPRVAGELKVPGFSTYIHPLDESHLLTIGIHMPDPDDPTAADGRAMKLTLFDVTDLANPKEKFTRTVGSSAGWSEATYEHKAFNYFKERQLLAIPFSDYAYSGSDYWGHFVSDLRVFHIDINKGIEPRGAISFNDVYRKLGYQQWGWYYSPWVRRSVMAADDDGNDFVYAISDAGIRVAELDALGSPIKTVQFPVPEAK